jgi:chromosome segregation ATPase
MEEQLKRKEQECERWQAELADKASELQFIEEKIKPLMKRPDDLDCYALEWIVLAFADEFKQLKVENEELKKANEEKNELLSKLGCPTIATARMKAFTLEQQLDQLKSDNDSLKSELMQIYCYLDADKETIDQLKKDNEELKRLIAKQKNAKIQLSKLKDKQYKEFCDIKQTLAEIKEIAEKMKNMEEECGKCMSYTTIQCKQILQKISKVMPDEN